MVEDRQDEQSSLKTVKKRSYFTLVHLIINVTLILIASCGVYIWQNSKVKDLNSKLSIISSRSDTQNKVILSQLAKIAEIQNKTENTATVPDPVIEVKPDAVTDTKVEIVDSKRIGSMYGDKNYVIVTVKLTNLSETDKNIDITTFKLLDSSFNRYTSLREQQSNNSDYNYVLSILDLPKSSTVLTDQTLSKNEVVSGMLVFYVANTLKDFKLSYEGIGYPITVE